MTFRGYEIGARAIAAAIMAVVFVAVLAFAVSQCSQRRDQAAQSRVDKGQAAAASESARDSISTISNVSENEAASEDLGRQNEKDIRNAEGASDPVNPAAHNAGLRALCRRKAYSNDPRCRML